jgi:aerobic-type carbon monoxide dehydrogenase small subunit (CoxS/CutS family)
MGREARRRITVNGRQHEVVATPETPLLTVLRNDLGLVAAKYGCGLGRCGACTVLLDGKAAFSCLVPVGEVGERAVTTLEGLGTADDLHPLQQAFLDEQAAQCGYCTAGIVMTAAALLDRNPDPSDAEIRAALAGTLCRCGSHPRILKAVKRAAEAMTPASEPTL